jgi:hypothetical protein
MTKSAEIQDVIITSVIVTIRDLLWI